MFLSYLLFLWIPTTSKMLTKSPKQVAVTIRTTSELVTKDKVHSGRGNVTSTD